MWLEHLLFGAWKAPEERRKRKRFRGKLPGIFRNIRRRRGRDCAGSCLTILGTDNEVSEKKNRQVRVSKGSRTGEKSAGRRDRRRSGRDRRRREECNKGGRRMPRLPKARKDVDSCEKLRGTANELRSGDIRMGQPGRQTACHRRKPGRTRGTETSKYPQEKKEISMSGVVASETDRAQTGRVKARPG